MNKINSLYIHFPHCLHLCNYCDFFKNISLNLEKDINYFENNLEKGIKEIQKTTSEFNYYFDPLQTLYIGGGTPSLWGESGAKFLSKFISNHFGGFTNNYEFTLEVNPKAWNKEIIEAFIDVGVNRFSIGIQSTNEKYLKLLDRFHGIEDVYELLEFMKLKQVNFSVDLMLGLPFSNKKQRKISEEIKEMVNYNPNHFSVYILTVKENYKYWSGLPTDEEIELEYLEMVDCLKVLGYDQYEVSNFSKLGFESRHNVKYWNSESVLALGPSATGFLSEERFRYKWNRDGGQFEFEKLNPSQFELEKIYMKLRTKFGLNRADLNITEELFEDLGQKWNNRSYVEFKNINNIRLSARGYLMLDSLMNDLYPYIK